MALTRIVKGMLAGSSVTPENLVNTSTYTVGGLVNTGNASIAGTLSIGSTLTVTSGLGLKIDGIALSSATNLVYYDPVTKQVTYAGPGPSGNPFNQTLNTNSNVTFAGVQVNGRITATSITIGGQTLGGAGTGLTLGTLTATNVITNFLNVNSTATWYTPIGFESFKIKATDVVGNFGRFSTNLNFELQPVGSVVVAGAGSSITGDIQNIRSDLGRGLTLSTRQRFSNGTFSSIRSAVIIGGETNVTATTLEDITLRGNAVALDVDKLLPFPTGPGTTIRSVDIGSTSSRFNVVYARSINVLNNTIYFEDEEGTTTSTFSVSTGTISVDGTQYVDQPLTQASTPTFAGINVGTVGFSDLTATNATITNLTVLGTMTTLNVTTENVTTENIVTQNYADGTSQTTAWTGTVADSQITSVSTSKVNGLSVVGWTNNYNDLINKPTIPSPFDLSTVTNQALFTTSTVTFQNVRTANTLTFAGAVARMAGVRLASFITPGVAGNILFYNTTTGETGWFPGPNQNVSTSSVVTFAGVTTTNITVRGSVVFNDATTQGTTGQTTVYARNALPSGTTGRIITISDSGSDTNSPAGNWAPAYWDPDANVWTYIGNSNSVTPI